MTLNEYQEKAMTTCLETSHNVAYMVTNLVGEVGEFCSKIAKRIRKQEQPPLTNFFTLPETGKKYLEEAYGFSLTPDEEKELRKEAGDILWQLQGLCSVFGWKLEEIAQENLDKLASRKSRNTIDGNGDDR